MPYHLELGSEGHSFHGKAIVVNSQTGEHKSHHPIPMDDAKAQMRVLESVASHESAPEAPKVRRVLGIKKLKAPEASGIKKEGSNDVAHIPWIPKVNSIVKRLVFAKRMMFKAMDIAILNMTDISEQWESGSPEAVKGVLEHFKETMPMGIQNISQEDANVSQIHDELKTIKLEYHKGAYNQGQTTWGIYDSPDVSFLDDDVIGCRIGIRWQHRGKGDWSTDAPGKPWWGVIRLTCEYNVKTKKTEWSSHVRCEYEKNDDEEMDDYVERSLKELSTKHKEGWSYAHEGEDFIVKEAPSVLTFVQKVLDSEDYKNSRK